MKTILFVLLVVLGSGCAIPRNRPLETRPLESKPLESEKAPAAKSLDITGYGKIFYEVDTADIRFSVSVRDPEVLDCKTQHDAVIAELNEYLKGEGYPPESLSLEASSLERVQKRNREDAYYLSKTTYSLRTERIAELGELQASIVQIGVDEIDQVRLFTSDQRRLEDEARAAAVADAKRKARAIAKELGWSLGAPVEVEFTHRGPRGFGSRSSAATGSSTVVAAGNFVDATVRVSFAYDTSP